MSYQPPTSILYGDEEIEMLDSAQFERAIALNRYDVDAERHGALVA
jgi:hypothetical protein